MATKAVSKAKSSVKKRKRLSVKKRVVKPGPPKQPPRPPVSVLKEGVFQHFKKPKGKGK